MCIKQFLLVCTFIIWCLFSSWSECSEISIGTVVILPLIRIGSLSLTFSLLKQLILDQSRQNGYQTVPFGMYIHNLIFVFILSRVLWKECRYRVVNLPLVRISYLYKVLIYLTKLDKLKWAWNGSIYYVHSSLYPLFLTWVTFVILFITKMIYCVSQCLKRTVTRQQVIISHNTWKYWYMTSIRL